MITDTYYSNDELDHLNIKKRGTNLRISRKASLYDGGNMEFGNNVRIDDFCVLSGKLVFGSHVHIACFCFLAGGDEGITFNDFSGFAYRVTAFTRSDDYSGETLTNPTIPEHYRHKTTKKCIYVKKHAIVGAGSVIMPGAHLEEGVSVGALSLITKPTEAWGIYVGIPAKRTGTRKTFLLEQEREFLSCGNPNKGGP
ncbi:MAG: acyltransferase [Peptococcaceae bacterium]|nr:acyltransferase [Peptococcaceae bacterium]